MIQYQVHIPQRVDELSGLVRKIVKYLERRGQNVPVDSLLYSLDMHSIEIISQGETLSSPSYPNNQVVSRVIELNNLELTTQPQQSCGVY